MSDYPITQAFVDAFKAEFGDENVTVLWFKEAGVAKARWAQCEELGITPGGNEGVPPTLAPLEGCVASSSSSRSRRRSSR